MILLPTSLGPTESPAADRGIQDLYSSAFRAFRKVILPLVAAGRDVGSMPVFIPAVGDLHQRRLPGQHADHDDRQRHPETVPGGHDHPAPAPSFALMAMILVALSHARAPGTEDPV